MSDREKTVIRLLETEDSITRKDVENALEISQSTAVILLREITEKYLIKKDGAGKNLKYLSSIKQTML